jgi:hypothetical protein
MIGLYEGRAREHAQIRTSDGINRRGQMLKAADLLKQIRNHPAQYMKERTRC